MFLHEAEVVETADKQPAAIGTQVKVHFLVAVAVQVVSDILGQVHVEHDEVVDVAAREGIGGGRQATAPLANATQGIQAYAGRGLHVL